LTAAPTAVLAAEGPVDGPDLLVGTEVDGVGPGGAATGAVAPRVIFADPVWKLRTPASPATVAAITSGACLI